MTTDALTQTDGYLSSKEAGKLLGYTHDYISKLCRDGKMSGVQRGRVWYVTEAEALAFKARHEAELEEKKAQLSQKFSAIRQEHEAGRKKDEPVVVRAQAEKPAAEPFVPDNLPGATEEVDFTIPAFARRPEPVAASAAAPVIESKVAEPELEAIPVSETPFVAEPAAAVSEPVMASEPTASVTEKTVPAQKRVEFSVPRHLVAAAVLALVIFAPTIGAQLTSGTSTSSSTDFSLAPMVEHFDNGVAAVLDAQAELIPAVANTFSFVQYLSDGYTELGRSATKLCQGFYSFLDTISDSYLALYEFQGEAIYGSLGQIGSMGATVLQGYELVGQSLVVGSKNVLNSYSDMLMVDHYLENLKKN